MEFLGETFLQLILKIIFHKIENKINFNDSCLKYLPALIL